MISRALLSVSDKTGIIELAQALCQLGVSLLSTGGTARLLKQHQIPVQEVSDYTGFPEIMNGRVKTLHPKIHGGLLGRPIDQSIMEEQGIVTIDLLVVNLYPFNETVKRLDCTPAEAIENIDIGGPAMLRAAAKNHERVTVLVDPKDYQKIVEAIKANQDTDLNTRKQLAQKAFAHTSAYDAAISDYLSNKNKQDLYPGIHRLELHKKSDLRYGENPHQSAALYLEKSENSTGVAHARQLQGKALSFNNLVDADAAWECVQAFNATPTCCIVKHANPCGVAQAETLLKAYEQAYRADPSSAFGGIIAFNTELDAQTAEKILENQFVEVIIAPLISQAAKQCLGTKPNIRVLCVLPNSDQPDSSLDYRRIHSGWLVQQKDTHQTCKNDLKVVTQRIPDEQEIQDLLFAWQLAKFVKSNAIVYAKDRHSLGIGAGQPSRIMSAKIAGLKALEAGWSLTGCVMASDAFFPFRDSIDLAADAGIQAIIQPGGSLRDEEVIAAANEHGLSMVFTGIRHFRH